MKKFVGKPYAGKPHVRFDEGVGKVFLSFPLYSTVVYKIVLWNIRLWIYPGKNESKRRIPII
jgi:hypothetical protein